MKITALPLQVMTDGQPIYPVHITNGTAHVIRVFTHPETDPQAHAHNQIGVFHWAHDTIRDVLVIDTHRRRGIATAMRNIAVAMTPELRHSTDLTPSAVAWIAGIADEARCSNGVLPAPTRTH